MPLLTVFTPTYNRQHTLKRTFDSLCRQTCLDFLWLIIDDGSHDQTKQWVESLGDVIEKSGTSYNWMGVPDNSVTYCHFLVITLQFQIEYLYKPNGGLYTAYNAAYSIIQTELCVCVDSDDFLPDNAVEAISSLWTNKGSYKYCGIEGLDFDIKSMSPIGGYFPNDLTEVYLNNLHSKRIHKGDTKQVMRTTLMKDVIPQIGFEGEKNFNPIYLLQKVCDKYPLLVYNDCLCIVDYQYGIDSMSQSIFNQYIDSPRSFAKMRLQEMALVHNTLLDRFRSAIHYVSSCLLYRDKEWLRQSPKRFLTLLAVPFGFALYLYIKHKTRI